MNHSGQCTPYTLDPPAPLIYAWARMLYIYTHRVAAFWP